MPIRGDAGVPEKKRGGAPSAGRWLIGVAVTALLLLLTAGGGSLLRAPEPLARLRMADGTSIAVEAVTAAPEHRLVRGNRLQQWLLPVVPSGLRERLGGDIYENTPSNPDSLVVWLSWPKHPTSGWSWRLVAVDEQGLECGDARLLTSLSSSKGEVDGVAWELTAAPRRKDTLHLRFYEDAYSARPRLMGEFRVPNPDPGPHAVLNPEPFPIVRRQDGLEFSLLDLRTGLAGGGGQSDRPAKTGEAGWTAARLQVSQAGKPAPWHPVDLELTDATGNRWEFGSSSAAIQGDAVDYRVHGVLIPSEPAYRLKVEFSRTSDYLPEELWTLRGVGIPGKGEANMLGKQRQVGGVPLRLVGISGPGGKLPEKVRHEHWDEHVVYLKTSAPTEGRRLTLASVTDPQGREIPTRSASWGDGEYSFTFEPPPGVTAANFTFALHRSRFVEFIAKATMPPSR